VTRRLPDDPLEEFTTDARREDTRILINELLIHLTQKEQTILAACYFRRQLDKEIAIDLKLEVHTVKRIRRQALHKLKELLE
jgi:DNA-directed RNA polymerase specialized sigma subunit